MLNIVLYQPEIPPNTGNIIRLAANTGFALHLIEPLGFTLDEKRLQRAGLDYHEFSRVQVHRDWAAYRTVVPNGEVYAITTKGKRVYSDVRFVHGDTVVFGRETAGLPPEFLASLSEDHRLLIPMQAVSRSLNLSNAAAVVCYEAWRQFGFKA